MVILLAVVIAAGRVTGLGIISMNLTGDKCAQVSPRANRQS
jgi:hypothetical protein